MFFTDNYPLIEPDIGQLSGRIDPTTRVTAQVPDKTIGTLLAHLGQRFGHLFGAAFTKDRLLHIANLDLLIALRSSGDNHLPKDTGQFEFGAQFLAYSLAKRGSKTPEQFGKGAPEGLIASEASISACTSTTMVPLLALGIPVDPLMAMILSVFMIHNYIPGPRLFVEHPEFISGLYISLFLLNIVVLIILLFATPVIMRLARVEPRYIGMTVLVLSLVGCYTQNYRISDALIAVFFGIVGKIMLRNDFPGFPLVIGLVLGPLFENRMMQSLALSSGDPTIFLTRPIAAALLAIAAVGIAIFIAGLWRQRNETAAPEPLIASEEKTT